MMWGTNPTRISRADLQSEAESSDGEAIYSAPMMDFEFVEVNRKNDTQDSIQEDSKDSKIEAELEEEFDFPMFSIAADFTTDDRTKIPQVMRISLKEQEDEPEVIQERSRDFYFWSPSESDKHSFIACAVEGEAILQNCRGYKNSDYNVIDLAKHNYEVEKYMLGHKKKDLRRPGKKARVAIILRRQRQKQLRKEGPYKPEKGYHTREPIKIKFGSETKKKTRRGGKRHKNADSEHAKTE
ncbi:unnamed protein product [Kuraishia capsulata CBS 1993]|uniref:Uncharacterized protein n=1 Tax=Kuraishia capsulata CBS 1993 TaxID=1382522 RepID=W6MJ59_9ASCO|nr:uncharacterized protein KUCA_T00002496001 [Kuraishia capsulata CBS 1993]CDK26524.1 unnamed protein product [Kuraishia capsulata CBS 1993]